MSTQAFAAIQTSKHWDEQVAYLEQVPISQSTAKLMNCPKHATIIRQLLSNPRSKVITTVCQFLVQLIDKYGPVMHPFINILIGTEVLWKLVNSSNKVVFMSVNELMKAIVVNCGNSKFWALFSQQMGSKNVQVRQAISSYMLVLADNIQMPSNYAAFIRKWKTDANKVVRENVIQLEEYVNHQKVFKESKISIQNKQNVPDPKKKTKKQKPASVQQSQQQIIVQSFINNSLSQQNTESLNYDSCAVKQDIIQNIQFLLSKIEAHDETWSMKLYAIQQICQLYQEKIHLIQESVALKMIGLFAVLLDQRRSRVNLLMAQMLIRIIRRDAVLFSKFIDHNFGYFIEQAGKNQQQGPQIISMTVDINPQKFVLQLAQSTVDIKSIKQKIMLFDILVQKICEHGIRASKVPMLVKLMCKYIEKYSHVKQIYLPCLAIMSSIKSAHSQQFLTCMLSQQKTVLTKFLQVAELVDPSLRQAIITYLHSLKAPVEKEKKDPVHNENHKEQSQLRTLIEQVANCDEEGCVAKLVEYVFEAQQDVTVRQFYQIIKLTERVVSKSSLVQLQLLLEQICKSQNPKFIEALFQAMADCNGNTIQSEYIFAYLTKVHLMLTKCTWLMSSKYANKLITLYRLSKCPKTRLMVIKTLAHFPVDLISSHVNNKEKSLIESQQKIQNLSHLSSK